MKKKNKKGKGMVNITFINDNNSAWVAACGDYSAQLPVGISRHSFEPSGGDMFVFGPPEVQFPYGSEQPIFDGVTYVFYAKIVNDVPHVFENRY